ncbi:hypothetical protein RB653_007589 [Dictyostelium firmibasis]|uniref:EGF-like domain-containing protein n=1 Tax=Dictyostelium firmibasis TaxID=79012 RepID=A0AAN7TWQ6_9MYCE
MNLKTLYFLFLLFLFFEYISSQKLVDFEYDILVNFTQKTGQSGLYPINAALNYIDFCNTTSFTCLTDEISGENIVININYENIVNSTYVLTSNDLKNLLKLIQVTIKGFSIDSYFVSEICSISFELTLNDCTLLGLSGLITNRVVIQQVTVPLTLTLDLSQFASLSLFSLIEQDYTNLLNISINNDLLVTNSEIVDQFYVTANNIPDLTSFYVKGLTLTINGFFSQNPNYNNLKTFVNVESYSLICNGHNLKFAPFNEMKNSFTYLLIFSSCNFDSVPANYSFSGLTNLQSVGFEDEYQNFINSSKKDLKSFNFQKSVSTFVYTDGNLPNFNNLNEFYQFETVVLINNSMNSNLPKFEPFKSNISCLTMNYNGLTGTIGEEYCGVFLNVSYNSLTGKIPNCFKCYWDIMRINFHGNPGLTNYDGEEECTSMVPNIYLNKNEGYLYVFGTSLGLFGYPFIIDPQATNFYECSVVVQNTFYKCSYNPSKPYPTILNLEHYLGYKFTFAVDPTPPLVSNVNALSLSSGNTSYMFSGLYFSYNYSITNIQIGGEKCEFYRNNDISFTNMNCTVVSKNLNNQLINSNLGQLKYPDLPLNYLKVSVTINGLLQNFTIRSDSLANPVISCGTCPGYCDYQIGVCQSYCPDPTCSGRGTCDEPKGWCACNVQYTGQNCTLANQYASSFITAPASGGNVTIGGWFGDVHDQLIVLIGNQSCNISNVNNDTIICSIGSLKPGIIDVNISQNNVTWLGPKSYILSPEVLKCPNACTNKTNGICNTTTGVCNCNSGWYGNDCSSPFNPNNNGGGQIPTTSTTVNNNGSTSIVNDKTNYQISIPQLLELDINGKLVRPYSLLKNWNYNETSNNVFVFNQILTPPGSNLSFTVSYMIEEITAPKNYSFAGYNFNLDKGSVKISLSVQNYPYQSSLNYLQIQFESSVSLDQEEDCNTNDSSIDSSANDQELLNYVNIQKDSKTLQARFLNRILSDGRPTTITSQIVSTNSNSIIIGLNLPHCTSCIIDPDFSVLISTNFQTSCDDDGKRASYIIPVAVVSSVVGVCVLGTVIFFIIKKRRDNKFFKSLSSRG